MAKKIYLYWWLQWSAYPDNSNDSGIIGGYVHSDGGVCDYYVNDRERVVSFVCLIG